MAFQIESRRQLQDRIVLFPHLIRQASAGHHGDDGDDDFSYERIIGGEEATPNEFPFMVGIEIDSEYFCGGSLIGKTINY